MGNDNIFKHTNIEEVLDYFDATPVITKKKKGVKKVKAKPLVLQDLIVNKSETIYYNMSEGK